VPRLSCHSGEIAALVAEDQEPGCRAAVGCGVDGESGAGSGVSRSGTSSRIVDALNDAGETPEDEDPDDGLKPVRAPV